MSENSQIEFRKGRADQSRERNPFWKGGRTIASNGYVLIKVGTEHHLSDVRGYAYEHRVVAERKLGRRLLPGEVVHHVDHDKQNNADENIEVKESQAEHALEHRKRDDLRLPDEPNLQITCACGCGRQFQKFDGEGRPRKFVSGHNATQGPDGRLVVRHV